MIHNITENIQGLAVDIELLIPLENNARRGDVDAIMASYSKFGQVKPIVAVTGDNGELTVIAGNHQLEAAKPPDNKLISFNKSGCVSVAEPIRFCSSSVFPFISHSFRFMKVLISIAPAF
jgi:hypothetical protein